MPGILNYFLQEVKMDSHGQLQSIILPSVWFLKQLKSSVYYILGVLI